MHLGHLRPGREQGDVPAGEIEMLEVPDLELLAAVAEINDVASRACRRDRRDLVQRELALGENVQHLASDIARRSDNRDPVAHCLLQNSGSQNGSRAYRNRNAKAIDKNSHTKVGTEGKCARRACGLRCSSSPCSAPWWRRAC